MIVAPLLADGGVTVRWDAGTGEADLPSGYFALAPCAAWAGEDVNAYSTGPAPMPTAEQLLEGCQCREQPHPKWAQPDGCCDACRSAAARPLKPKGTTRPIRIGERAGVSGAHDSDLLDL